MIREFGNLGLALAMAVSFLSGCSTKPSVTEGDAEVFGRHQGGTSRIANKDQAIAVAMQELNLKDPEEDVISYFDNERQCWIITFSCKQPVPPGAETTVYVYRNGKVKVWPGA